MLENIVVSKYFELKTTTEEFKEATESLINSLVGKKVLIYGADPSFKLLESEYNIKERLDIIGISDKKFNSSDVDIFDGLKVIKAEHILDQEFDFILISNEAAKSIAEYLKKEIGVSEKKIVTLFREDIKDEAENYNFLIKNKFEKTLPKLLKKMKNKKVILYGAGSFLELIKKYFDISSLDVIGISDKKYVNSKEDGEFLGYKIIPPEKISEQNPDYVIVCTKFYVRIIEDLKYNILKKTKIKIKPLVEKSFMTLFKEIQGMP